jgi:hypothetical protein
LLPRFISGHAADGSEQQGIAEKACLSLRLVVEQQFNTGCSQEEQSSVAAGNSGDGCICT